MKNKKMMNDTYIKHESEEWYSIEKVSKIYGINPWTIRMWTNRFNVLKPRKTEEGDILFDRRDIGCIGKICNLIKDDRLSLNDIRKYLELNTESEVA